MVNLKIETVTEIYFVGEEKKDEIHENLKKYLRAWCNLYYFV